VSSEVLAKAVLAQDIDSESWVRLCQTAGEGVVGLANNDLSLSIWAAMLMLLLALTLDRHYAAFSVRRFNFPVHNISAVESARERPRWAFESRVIYGGAD
jgi:hypothetical protein